GGPMTGEQAQAFTFLRSLAEQGHYRVIPDVKGYPLIPGRRGAVEFYTSTGLAIYSDRPRAFSRLEALPGITRWQVGSTERRWLAPVEALPSLAPVLGLRRRRTLTPEAARQKGAGTAYRPSSGA